ncbi:hypothetical protein Tco_1226570 [Tanacetum coccineum]
MLFTMPSWKQVNPPYKFTWTKKTIPITEGSSETTTKGYMENYKNVSQDIRNQLDAEAEAVQIILTGIYNDIHSTIDAYPNACEIWKAIERLKQGESINVQDFETNVYWEFGKFTSWDGESLESYYSMFYKMMNEQSSQELKTVSYHKLYDILKQHQNEVNEIRAERLARTANLLAVVDQQQPVYHPQNHPNHYTHNSSTKSQQAATRNRGKAIVNYPLPTYDQEPKMVTEDDALSKEKEIDKLMALVSLSLKKSTNLPTTTLELHQTPVEQIKMTLHRLTEALARECKKPKQAKDAAYHKGKMLLCKQEEAGFQLNAEQADWRDDTDDEPDDQELEAHYMYMAQIQELTPDDADNSGPIFDTKPLQKEQEDTNITIDSIDMSTNEETVDQADDDLARERDLFASFIKKLKCEIDDSKNRNKFLESSNKALVNKLKGEIEDFKTKNKSSKSSNNHFKEANNELLETNQLMFKDLKKFQAELDRYHDVNYATKVEIDCAKANGDLVSYKMKFQKSFNESTRKINDLNQTISKMKKEIFAHQETISIMSQEKEAHNKFCKTCGDKEIEKVIALENKVKVLDDIVYKTSQSVQTMNMLNRNCKTSFVKPEYLKKAQRANPRLYDIGCYNDNIALMLAPESDEMIRLAQESRYLIKPFDYKNLNNRYDLFVPQREKSPEQRYFSKRSKMSHTSVKNDNSKESFNKHTMSEPNNHFTSYYDEQEKSVPSCFVIYDLELLSLSFNFVFASEIFKSLSFCLDRLCHLAILCLDQHAHTLHHLESLLTISLDRLDIFEGRSCFKSQRQSVLGKPASFSDSLAKTDFSKSKSVTTNNVSNDFSKPVTAQILPQNVKSILKNTNVIAPGMYKVHTKPNQTRTQQFPQDIRKTNKRVSFSTRSNVPLSVLANTGIRVIDWKIESCITIVKGRNNK